MVLIIGKNMSAENETSQTVHISSVNLENTYLSYADV